MKSACFLLPLASFSLLAVSCEQKKTTADSGTVTTGEPVAAAPAATVGSAPPAVPPAAPPVPAVPSAPVTPAAPHVTSPSPSGPVKAAGGIPGVVPVSVDSPPASPSAPVTPTPVAPTAPAPVAPVVPASLVPAPAEAAPKPLTEAREVEVKCVWVRSSTNEGGTSPIIVRIAPNPNGRVSISTPKEFASGTGNQWESTVWLAAICASEATGNLVSDYKFSVESSGHIDGPSAGMLITATMMALIRGEEILPNATMTGAINPDGSVGTVGGVYSKLHGARKDGIVKFGYPVGCRMSQNPATKDAMEDLEIVGAAFKNPGVDVQEIHNIYDAYGFLTGKPFPRAQLASEESMRIGNDLANRVRGAANRMRGTTQQRINTLRIKLSANRDKESREKNLAELNHAENQILRSKRFEDESSFSLSLFAAESGNHISLVNELRWEMGQQLSAGGLDSYEQVIGNQAVATLSYLKSLRLNMSSAMNRSTVGGKIDALHSFSRYWQGVALMEAGRANISQMTAAKEEMAAAFSETKRNPSSAAAKSSQNSAVSKYIERSETIVARFALAHTCAESAVYWSSFTQEAGPLAKDDTQLFGRLGNAYSSAAGVGLAWFDAVIVESYAESIARKQKISPARAVEMFKTYLQREDISYLPISLCAAGSEYSSHLLDGGEMQPIDKMASGIYAFHGAAGLMNEYGNYSDADAYEGQSLSFGNRRGFASTLDLARSRVLEKAGELERTAQFIPDAVKLNYEFANLMRDGSDKDRNAALKAYWKCLFFLDIALQLHKTPN